MGSLQNFKGILEKRLPQWALGPMKAISRAKTARLYNSHSWHQIPEIEQLKKFFSHYQIDCVFDVGANAGQYAEILRKKVGYKGLIVSFEPIPIMAALLRKKSARDPNWIVMECALDSQAGRANFNIMSSSQFSSLGTPSHEDTKKLQPQNKVSEIVSVEKKTLSDVYRELQGKYKFSRPFLKMDTQGFDIQVVRGGYDVIDNFIGLQSELSVKKLYTEGVYFHEALEFYRSMGFELTALFPNNAGHFPELIELDCIMYKKAPAISRMRSSQAGKAFS